MIARDMSAQRVALMVLALGTGMNLLSRGLGESFGVFLLPVAREFGADRAALTGVYSTYMLVMGLMSPFAGWAVDKLGPRRCYLSGVTLLSGAYLLAAQVSALWHLYLLIGGLSAIGSTLVGMVPASGLVSRWFQRRLPTAMGVLSAALGVGMLVLAPLTAHLIEAYGWRGAYRVLGGGLLLVLLPMAFLPWRRMAAGSADVISASQQSQSGQQAWNLPLALRTTLFWALAGVMFVTSVTTYLINVQLVAYLVERGYSPVQAASLFGLMGMLSIAGMMGAGVLAERIGERWTATLSYSTSIIGLGMLTMVSASTSGWWVLAFALTFGTMQGSRGPLVATLTARNFPGAMGRVYGMVLLGMGAGAAAGSWASGFLFDATGGYVTGFAVAALSALVGMALFWTVRGLSGRGHLLR